VTLNCSAGSSSDHQEAADARCGEALEPVERRFELVGRDGLGDERKAPRSKPVLALVLDRQDLNRDMACFGAALQLIENRPTQHVRQEYIERHGGRAVLARQRQRIGRRSSPAGS